MTCPDARELYSPLADEALTADERGALDTHLAGCAECRRELERFQASVALVRGLPPARAPIGFVDRVVQAARPTPWPRRLARALVMPWSRKLPLEAAAMLMIGGLAVLVFQRTPELQQATRVEAPESPGAPARAELSDRQEPDQQASKAGPGSPDSARNAVTPTGTRAMEGRAPGESEARLSASQRDAANREAVGAMSRPARSPLPAPSGEAPAAPAPPGRGTPRSTLSSPPAAPEPAVPAPSVAAPSGPAAGPAAPQPRVAPARPSEETSRIAGTGAGRGTAADRATPAPSEGAAAAAGQSAIAERPAAEAEAPRRQRILTSPPPEPRQEARPPSARDAIQSPPPAVERQDTGAIAKQAPVSTGAASPPARVSSRLAVREPATAERDILALASSLGGRLLARRAEGDDVVLELTLPRDRWSELSQRLAGLGEWQHDRPPAPASPAVLLTIRLTR